MIGDSHELITSMVFPTQNHFSLVDSFSRDENRRIYDFSDVVQESGSKRK